jgi:hypothetical protein
MLQVIAIINALVSGLGAFSGTAVPSNTLTQISAALAKATALLTAFQGIVPPTSIDADMKDLYVLVGAIEATGIVPAADAHFADISAIIAKFQSVETDLASGQFALFFKFARNGKIVDVGGFEEGGAFQTGQLGG